MDEEGKMAENNYDEKFLQARSAYLEGDLDQASQILDQIIDDNPEDPSVLLLRGHIHLSDREYQVAKNKYEKVLELTDHEDLVQLARDGLEKIAHEPQDDDFQDLSSLEEIHDKCQPSSYQ